MTTLLPTALMLALAGSPEAPPNRGEYDPSPRSPIPPGWSELDLRLEVPGAAGVVDTTHFCGLPCRILVPPGEHAFRVVVPGQGEQDHVRLFEDGLSVLFDGVPAADAPAANGGVEEDSTDGWSIALYTIGTIALLTATGLVAADVALNLGGEQSDWTNSYAAAGLGPVGLALAIWGAVRGSDDEESDAPDGSVDP